MRGLADLDCEDNVELKKDVSECPEVKMFFRLVGLDHDPVEEPNPQSKAPTAPMELKWYIAADTLPLHLTNDINMISNALEHPFQPDDGKTLRDYIKKIPKPRAPRRPEEWSDAEQEAEAFLRDRSPHGDDDSDQAQSDSDGSAGAVARRQAKMQKAKPAKSNKPRPAPRLAKAATQQQAWTHKDYIEDSDEELAAIDAAVAAAGGGSTQMIGRAAAAGKHGSSGEESERLDYLSSPPTSSVPERSESTTIKRKRSSTPSNVDTRPLFLGSSPVRDDEHRLPSASPDFEALRQQVDADLEQMRAQMLLDSEGSDGGNGSIGSGPTRKRTATKMAKVTYGRRRETSEVPEMMPRYSESPQKLAYMRREASISPPRSSPSSPSMHRSSSATRTVFQPVQRAKRAILSDDEEEEEEELE